MTTRKERRGKRGTKTPRRKNFQIKEENENISSFNFYLQVLVLVITEMQMQPHK